MRVKVRIDKEDLMAKWGSWKEDEIRTHLKIPATVTCTINRVIESFRLFVELGWSTRGRTAAPGDADGPEIGSRHHRLKSSRATQTEKGG